MEKHKKSKKTIISIGVFSLGIATLAGGAGFFLPFMKNGYWKMPSPA